jgi:hypothetical protein
MTYRGSQKWTIQRNWQHWVHKKNKTKPNHNTKCVGQYYTQTNTKPTILFSLLGIDLTA